MARYILTISGDSTAELISAVIEAAALLEYGSNQRHTAAELAPLADPIGPTPEQAPLPTPAPDYQAAGLTDYQAIQARQAQAEPAPLPVWPAAPQAPQQQVQQAAPGAAPQCQLGHGPMLWKGGGLSKSGKGLPLWSCSDRNCQQAIWPPRA